MAHRRALPPLPRRSAARLALLTLLFAAAGTTGCGMTVLDSEGNAPSAPSLVGTWVDMETVDLVDTNGDATEKITLVFDAGGAVTETITATGAFGVPCTGVIETSGTTWSATKTTIAFSAFNLAGAVGCPNVGWGDTEGSSDPSSDSFTCPYEFGDGGDSLLIVWPNSETETFQRQ